MTATAYPQSNMEMRAIAIDHHLHLGQITIVDSVGLSATPPRPFAQVAISLDETAFKIMSLALTYGDIQWHSLGCFQCSTAAAIDCTKVSALKSHHLHPCEAQQRFSFNPILK